MLRADLKTVLLQILGQFGLLPAAFRGWEHVRSLGGRSVAIASDGLPLPPPALLIRTAGTVDAKWFVESGRLAEVSIRAALARAGTQIESLEAILDFGCGCGRVLRRWHDLDAYVCGSDLNASAVKWCRTNLPNAEVSVNALEPAPPLKYGDATFDLVYALSVFTHLSVETQLAWCKEFCRVLRPGGYLLLSLHGDAYVERLKDKERQVYADGECVVRWAQAPGSNLCSAFHPPAFVRSRLADGWQLVEQLPCGALGNPVQDLVLLRKPAA
jgi:SAM-dependent methyltransferase